MPWGRTLKSALHLDQQASLNTMLQTQYTSKIHFGFQSVLNTKVQEKVKHTSRKNIKPRLGSTQREGGDAEEDKTGAKACGRRCL